MDEQQLEKIKKAEERRKKIIADIITGVVFLVLSAAIFCLYFFLMGKQLMHAVNGVALTGIIIISIGLLALVARLGAFDTFVFGFKQLGHSMFGKNPNQLGSLADYKEEVNKKRKAKGLYFIPILVVGALYILALIPLEIVFHVTY